MTLSGAKIGGIFWLILALAIIKLATYLYFKFKKAAHKTRLVLLVGSVLSLGIIAYQSIKVMLFPDIPFYIPSALINFHIKHGAWGTLAGLAMILASAPNMRAPHKEKSIPLNEKPDEPA
jgi:hypothetical protein